MLGLASVVLAERAVEVDALNDPAFLIAADISLVAGMGLDQFP
jgi:hypothetical protein